MGLTVRLASAADLPAIDAIYNHYVRTSTCTADVEPPTPDERRAWLDAHGEAYPATVAEDHRGVVGFGALSPYHRRHGYRYTVENTVYVRADAHRSGVGRAILVDLLARAAALRYRCVVASITHEQAASVALHARCGFVEVAHLRSVVTKFDRWLDLTMMQRLLDPEA